MKKESGVTPEVAPNHTYIHTKYQRQVTVTKIESNLIYIHWLYGNGPTVYTRSQFLREFHLAEVPNETDSA